MASRLLCRPGCRLPRAAAVVLAAMIPALALTGCQGPGAGQRAGTRALPVRTDTPPPPPDVVSAYRHAGLLAHGDPLPFAARVIHLASSSPETTLVLVTLALPSRSLTFAHSGDSYRAGYEVTVATAQGPRLMDSTTAREAVVVPSFRETVRTDESILFQRQLRLAPGVHELRLGVRDEGSGRVGTDTITMHVPRLDAGTLGTPAPYHVSEPRPTVASPPRLLVTPRATLTFSRDTVLRVYVEGYGAAGGEDGAASRITVLATVSGEDGAEVWRDSATLAPTMGGGSLSGGRELASGTLTLPAARLGMGAAVLHVWRPAGGDTVHAPLFITFGDALPAATFEDMLGYLRFFAAPSRLEALRRASSDERGAAWAALLDAAGGADGTSGEQVLQRYFARIQVANQRYRDEAGPGWLSDRGMVFTALGDPDLIEEPSRLGPFQQGGLQRWSYRELRLQLEFQDAAGFGHWRLTPASEVAFRATLARMRA